jgi:hypothetical protein
MTERLDEILGEVSEWKRRVQEQQRELEQARRAAVAARKLEGCKGTDLKP